MVCFARPGVIVIVITNIQVIVIIIIDETEHNVIVIESNVTELLL